MKTYDLYNLVRLYMLFKTSLLFNLLLNYLFHHLSHMNLLSPSHVLTLLVTSILALNSLLTLFNVMHELACLKGVPYTFQKYENAASLLYTKGR